MARAIGRLGGSSAGGDVIELAALARCSGLLDRFQQFDGQGRIRFTPDPCDEVAKGSGLVGGQIVRIDRQSHAQFVGGKVFDSQVHRRVRPRPWCL